MPSGLPRGIRPAPNGRLRRVHPPRDASAPAPARDEPQHSEAFRTHTAAADGRLPARAPPGSTPPPRTDYTFGQWVYTIARNTFIDFMRKRQDDLPIDERFASPPASGPTPEESVIRLQQRTQIEHYLERLAPRYRQLVRMRFFDEYSYEEIAAKLALPLGTVKTQIHRAREQMCRMIKKEE